MERKQAKLQEVINEKAINLKDSLLSVSSSPAAHSCAVFSAGEEPNTCWAESKSKLREWILWGCLSSSPFFPPTLSDLPPPKLLPPSVISHGPPIESIKWTHKTHMLFLDWSQNSFVTEPSRSMEGISQQKTCLFSWFDSAVEQRVLETLEHQQIAEWNMKFPPSEDVLSWNSALC